MKPLKFVDVQSHDAYMARRDEIRRRIIALKKRRRIPLGPRVSLVFENRDTMLFQVQEMCRIEHITVPKLIQEEIDVYNDLLPEGMAIGATLMIELVQTDDMPRLLKELRGLEETVWLRLGGEAIHAEAESGRSTEEKTSTVHYLTFRFTPQLRQALTEASHVILATEHPHYRFQSVLPQETVVSLADDLMG